MKKEKQKIVNLPGVYLKDNEGVLDYKVVVIEENDQVKLFLCAVGEAWTEHIKNTVLFKITDTGNGIKIGPKYRLLLENGNDGEGIEYNVAEYLRILMNFNDATGHMPSNYTCIIESEISI
jgi:hypothetical protein